MNLFWNRLGAPDLGMLFLGRETEGGKEGEKEEVAARQRNVMRVGPARYVEGRRRCDYIMFGPILPRVPPRPPPRSPPRFFIHTVMSVTSPNS